MIGNEPTGRWVRNSGVDNPRFLATQISMFLDGGKTPGAVSGNSYAMARPLQGFDPGRHLFNLRCTACHTFGQGDAVGPDLLGVTNRRQRAWLERYLAQPEKMLADRDPIATALFGKYRSVRMPNLRLSQDEIAAILSYLEGRSAAQQQAREVSMPQR